MGSVSRYLPHTAEDVEEMQKELGISSPEELFQDIPGGVRLHRPLSLPPPLSEPEILQDIGNLLERNLFWHKASVFLGGGHYVRHIPHAVDFLASRSEFYTAYTPYQPEVSQGTLQAIYEYQSVMAQLTGLDVSNASSYDGATALADAVRMAHQVNSRPKALLSRAIHPHYRQVVRTYTSAEGQEIQEIPLQDGLTSLSALQAMLDSQTSCVVIQNPNFFGCVEANLKQAAEMVHRQGALFILSVDPISLGILAPPGEVGADIATGEGQPLGNPLSFGGPSFGFLATRKEYIWKLPGRLVGRTVDRNGKPCYVLTLQAREQHIKREKATSNICTNNALGALRALIYLCLMGAEGLKEVNLLSSSAARYACDNLTQLPGVHLLFPSPFLFEFALQLPLPPEGLNSELLNHRIIGGYALERDYPEFKNGWLLAFTELTTKEQIDTLCHRVKEWLSYAP